MTLADCEDRISNNPPETSFSQWAQRTIELTENLTHIPGEYGTFDFGNCLCALRLSIVKLISGSVSNVPEKLIAEARQLWEKQICKTNILSISCALRSDLCLFSFTVTQEMRNLE